MALTNTETLRIQAIENKLNEIQLALNNVASKQQMKALTGIRQSEIVALQSQVVELESQLDAIFTTILPSVPTATVRIPRVIGGIVSVTGEELVDTGLTFGLATVNVSINSNNLIPDEESKITWYQLDPIANPSQFIIRVEKGGINDGQIGDSAVSVSWFAWEK